MKAPPPINEAVRLAKLRSYGLLDTPAEPVDERIVRMAARIFGVPMASISLIDENRQWLQASCGMPEREARRDDSFCAHTILGPDILIVNDAFTDPRFADNLFVLGQPHIRFYAGAPLKTTDGYPLGSLCVLDSAPRAVTPAEAETLVDLAALVMHEFALRRNVRRLAEEIEIRNRSERSPASRHRTNRFPAGPFPKRPPVPAPANDVEHATRRREEETYRDTQTAAETANLDGLTRENPDMFCLATLGGQITYLNEAGRKLTGVPSLQAARATYLTDYFPADQRAVLQKQVLPTVRVQGRWESEGKLVQAGTGTAISVNWSLFLLRDPGTGEPVGLGAIARDITRAKASEAAIYHAKEAAENANRAKSEFLASMSHELRTPLNSILGFGQLLGMQAADESQKECSSYIVNAGRHLLNLINEVLDIARIESGHVELHFERVLMSDAIAQTLDLIRPLAAEKKIAILTQDSAAARQQVTTDAKRFKQVLLNLVSNAIKYTPAGGSVTVSCEPAGRERLRVCVQDSGPGIAADKLERLFVPFERLGAEHTSVPGTGLGLALSKHLVEALGGTLGVASELGAGTRFWVELPPEGPPLSAPGGNGAPKAKNHPKPFFTSDILP